MNIVQSERLLKRRVDDYLWRDDSKTVEDLRNTLKKNFLRFETVSIFGGMIRDLARNGKRGFRSDVDLVINAPAIQVEELALELSAKPNMFGGFGYDTSRWKIDFWALENSWAHKCGLVHASTIDDLLDATFFDWDAVHYDLHKRRIYARKGYIKALKSRTMDVKLVENPSTLGNVVRAIRRAFVWDIALSNKLLDLIETEVIKSGLAPLIDYEIRKYTTSSIVSYRSETELISSLRKAEININVEGSSPRQLELPGILRPRTDARQLSFSF